MTIPGNIFDCHNLKGSCYWHLHGIEPRDAVVHPVMHRIAVHNQEISQPNVNSAKIEKPRTVSS